MRTKEQQLVLEDGYRPIRLFGKTRKITRRGVWVVRIVTVLAVLSGLSSFGAAPGQRVTVAALMGRLIGAAIAVLLIRAVAKWALSAPAPVLDSQQLTDVQTLPGVDAVEAQRIRNAGYQSVEAISLTESDEFVSEVALDDGRASEVLHEARKSVGHPDTARERLYGTAGH